MSGITEKTPAGGYLKALEGAALTYIASHSPSTAALLKDKAYGLGVGFTPIRPVDQHKTDGKIIPALKHFVLRADSNIAEREDGSTGTAPAAKVRIKSKGSMDSLTLSLTLKTTEERLIVMVFGQTDLAYKPYIQERGKDGNALKRGARYVDAGPQKIEARKALGLDPTKAEPYRLAEGQPGIAIQAWAKQAAESIGDAPDGFDVWTAPEKKPPTLVSLVCPNNPEEHTGLKVSVAKYKELPEGARPVCAACFFVDVTNATTSKGKPKALPFDSIRELLTRNTMTPKDPIPTDADEDEKDTPEENTGEQPTT